MTYNWDFSFLYANADVLLRGLAITILYTIVTIALGCAVGLLLGAPFVAGCSGIQGAFPGGPFSGGDQPPANAGLRTGRCRWMNRLHGRPPHG